jgi:transcriptional regulator with XRE-family HTH domain
MRKIRLAMRYSIAEFAELLGLKKATYQGYESGRRPLPKEVLKNAQAAQKREVKFFKGLPARVDSALKGKPTPNEATPNFE